MANWQVGGLPPTFNGPDFVSLGIHSTDTGFKDIGSLFSVDEGPMTFANLGASPVGVTFDPSSGIYSWSGAVTPGTYAMHTQAKGVDVPPSTADYTWQLVVTAGTLKPVFSGPIGNLGTDVNATFDLSGYATGETSYSISPALPAGMTFNTATGVLTVVVASTPGPGNYGPFTVGYINSAGTTNSDAFTVTVIPVDLGSPPVFSGSIGNGSDYLDYTINAASFFTGASSYSISPTPHSGITIDSVTGLIRVVAATAGVGSYGPYTVSGTNPAGSTPSNTFTLAVVSNPGGGGGGGTAPVFAGSIPNYSDYLDYTVNASAYFTGATGYSISPALPPGITLNTGTGLITVATGTVGVGSYGPFVVTGSNTSGSAPSNSFSLVVVAAPNVPVYVTVPDLHGLMQDEASNLLGILGLTLAVSSGGFDANVALGAVLAQNPLPNAQVDPNTTVNVTICQGVFHTWTPVAPLSEKEWQLVNVLLDIPPGV